MINIKKIIPVFILSITFILVLFLFKSPNNVKASVPDGYHLDNTYDLISVSSLTINGCKNQDLFRDNVNTNTSFDKEDNEGSLVFKFKYDVVDNTNTDQIAVRFHFDVADDMWNNDCSLWMRGDGVYLYKWNSSQSKFEWNKTTALSLGLHEIEFGRIALINNNTGALSTNYYVYYKVDGVEKDSTINPYDVSKMNGSMFVNFSDGNTMNKVYDIRYVSSIYEIPDRISVKDLKKDGASIGEKCYLNGHKTFSYDAQAEHKSVVFTFYYDCLTQSSIDCQFHLTDGWLGTSHGGIFWLRNDKNRISKVSSGYLETSAFSTEGLYEVEISKLYITSGDNIGKYYLSLKIDGTLALEYIIDEMPEKANLFTTGSNGDYIYDINYMPIELDSNLYLYKWDVEKSGIEFSGELRKDIALKNGIKEVGFIIYPQDDPTDETKLVGIPKESGNKYTIKAAVASLNSTSITKRYSAKLYYVIENYLGVDRTYYSKVITSSFYEELDDISELSEEYQVILNNIKANVLDVTIDEDTCEVVGASKSGSFSTSTLVLTGPNDSYISFVLNGDLIKNNDEVKIGYYFYTATLGVNSMTLTKKQKTIMYGGSEHFVELNSGHDDKMTAANLSPMAVELGLTTMRLDIDFGDLFSISPNNELTVNNSYVAKVQGVIDELKTNGGVNDFLAVFWVIQPYGFKDWTGKPWGGKTAPDPSSQAADYLKWLQINGEAARIAAELFPDIHSFETWNEAEMMCEADGPLARPDGTNYSVSEKAKILTDLMYYYNKGIKEANPKNVLTTPSICCSQQTDNDFDVTSPNFLKALYDAIVDSTPVTGYDTVDTDPNNYFQVINTHPYLERGTTDSNWNSFMGQFHNLSVTYNDGGTEIWITEFGFPFNRTSNGQSKMLSILQKAENLEYITKFYFYKIHDYTDKIGTDRWGLYDYDGNIKAVGTAVKNFIKG